MTTQNDVLETSDELDLSGDSAVEAVTAIWTIESAESEEVESDNGTGSRIVIEFTSDDWPYPITMRFFTSYESATGKNTDWVKRQRGQLKNVVKAATGETTLSLNADHPNYIVGKQVRATTRDGGDGFAILSRFKKAAE
jgi:hypothetical protein